MIEIQNLGGILKGKNILLGVSGSIAIYKSLEILRTLQKLGANVKVVMSEEAKKFIAPLSFEALSKFPALHKESESWTNGVNHIDYAAWGDILLIAPASANTINSLAHGISTNLLTDTYLAFDKKVLIAPSANEKMYLKPQTQESLAKLTSYGHEIIAPIRKELACGTKGIGALEEGDEIVLRTIKALHTDDFLGKKVVVSGGGSEEAIDCVRFIGNRSSGKMASSIALNLYFRGAEVTFVSSKTPYVLPKEIEMREALSAKDFLTTLQEVTPQCDILVMCAAIGDFRPKEASEEKIKKESNETLQLSLVQNEDILAALQNMPCKKIGFKAESDQEEGKNYAKKALLKKGLDAIALNYITPQTFGGDENEICFITKDSEEVLKKESKYKIADKLNTLIKNLC